MWGGRERRRGGKAGGGGGRKGAGKQNEAMDLRGKRRVRAEGQRSMFYLGTKHNATKPA